ncbi:unnamed protein product [Cuscuta epithymum]|uniref:Syntaxin 6/10/61 N-terminal domain-containing protein n=2 Tax=Cuscuta epithymum TaxID=186058 RepID=A0AAV0GA97_9ASTE|nr:unnamed protein product [Cuscuta epithymum]
MATHFDRWEKDPFFSAAEEVQESADRMESAYRTWIQVTKDKSKVWNSEDIRRDLKTALGTAKWQLEEFEKAVKSSYANSTADDSEHRHSEFVVAIDSQIKKVERSLNESAISQGKPPSPWVRLDEGERDELALFLSGNVPRQKEKPGEKGRLADVNEEKMAGHRRTASASADIGSWKIAVTDDVANTQAGPPPRKVPSFSGFLNTMECAAKFKFGKNGYRKLKTTDCHNDVVDATLPRTQELPRGINACYERCKSCLNGCDKCYDKQLYSWYGAAHRQIQRSQYYVQYSRSVRVGFTIILLCLIVFLALHM